MQVPGCATPAAEREEITHMLSRNFVLKMAQAKARIWPRLAYLFQVGSTAGRGQLDALKAMGVPRGPRERRRAALNPPPNSSRASYPQRSDRGGGDDGVGEGGWGVRVAPQASLVRQVSLNPTPFPRHPTPFTLHPTMRTAWPAREAQCSAVLRIISGSAESTCTKERKPSSNHRERSSIEP